MISQKQLEEEITQIIEDAAASGQVLPVSWLIQSVLKNWASPGGDDADRWSLCAQEHVRATVRRVSNRYMFGSGEAIGGDTQPVLEGFDRIQRAYFVKHDGERCLVPTDQLAQDEDEAKIQELKAMASGCEQHAEELRRYLECRRPKQAQSAS